MKTNKHQTLLLVKKQVSVKSSDLLRQFGYSLDTARSYLSHLGKQGLLERTGAGYSLTQKGQERLRHFDAFGCLDVACPTLCQGKTGYLTCPHCQHRIQKRDARISKKKDLFFAVRHPGVYCTRCGEPIFNEAQARLLGIMPEA